MGREYRGLCIQRVHFPTDPVLLEGTTDTFSAPVIRRLQKLGPSPHSGPQYQSTVRTGEATYSNQCRRIKRDSTKLFCPGHSHYCGQPKQRYEQSQNNTSDNNRRDQGYGSTGKHPINRQVAIEEIDPAPLPKTKKKDTSSSSEDSRRRRKRSRDRRQAKSKMNISGMYLEYVDNSFVIHSVPLFIFF